MHSEIIIAGVDEAGRGPLVGAVVAAAVILDPQQPIDGLGDSKKLSATKREQLAELIKERSLAWSVASVSADVIDEINILQATMRAMQQAVISLRVKPEQVLVDGNRCPDIPYPVEAIVKGDDKVVPISAASILAKVTRDAQMQVLHERYPEYGFDRHKGYGTKQHYAALAAYGPCPEHRRSFSPVKKQLELAL